MKPALMVESLRKVAGLAPKDGKKCVKCRTAFHFIGTGIPSKSKPGDVYSMGGARETKISGMCEHCFDTLFGG